MSHNYRDDFGPFDGRVWLNCAHQGPLPRAAAEEAREAVEWKVAPHRLTQERFDTVPRRLKEALGRLVNVPAEEIILGNSASYGLHLLANGIPWRAGDEVLLAENDFPSVVLPWLALRERGVVVRLVRPRRHVVELDELEAHLTPATRLFCATWVHSFSGHAVDAEALGAACRARGVRFVMNCAQGFGTRPLDLSAAPVDAVTSVGHKWLCGPYATGFCWMRPELLESLRYNQAYWLAAQTAADLEREAGAPALPEGLGARKYDVFGTANFFNFKTWAASVEYLLAQGVERIRAHNDALVSKLVEGVDADRYELISPPEGARRSTLVLLSAREAGRSRAVFDALRRERIDVAFRRGNLRFSPHLYNTAEDIDRALAVLHSA